MKLDFWGITKSVALVGIVVFVYLNFDKFLDKFGNDSPPPEPQIIKIEDNALLIKLAASDAKVKELKEELDKKDSLLLNYVKKNNEKIDEIGIIQAKLEQTVKLQQASAHVYLKGKVTDHHFAKIYKKASDGTEFPVAWAMFHPNQPDPNKLWKTGTYPLEFNVDIIETENKEGTFNRYAEINIENNQMRETRGNKYPVKINRLDWAKQERNDKSFSWFNPRLGFAMELTSHVAAPALDISLSSYGRTDTDMDWRFFEFAIGGTSDEVIFGFTPLSWNLGTVIPIVENAFIGGPSVVWSSDGDVSYGFKFSVPF